MAYYFGEEDKDQTEGAPETSKPSSVIPSGNVTAPNAVANAPVNASTSNARTNPGNFVGISQYLDANKPQSAALANKVGGVVTGAADTARAELGQKAAAAESGIRSNLVGYDQSAINQLNQDASKADLNKIQAMKNASYQGPNTLEDVGSLAGAKQAVANVDTEEGRKSLVGNLYKDQPLKKGALTFDNLLLQADPTAKDTLAAAKSKANIGGLENDIASEKARIEEAARSASASNAKTAADTRNAIAQAQGSFESNLQNRVNEARNQATREAQSALGNLRSGGGLTGQATDRDLQLLGITQDQFQKLISSGMNQSPELGLNLRDASTAINAGNVATADDYARYNVLKRLAEGGNFLSDDASQAGKYDSDLLDFNYVEPPAPVVAPAAIPRGGIQINEAGENDPNKAKILRNPDGSPVLDNGEPFITEEPASTRGGKNGALDKVAIGTKKALKKWFG